MDVRAAIRSEFDPPETRFRILEEGEKKRWKEPLPKSFKPVATRPNLKEAHDDESLRAILKEAGDKPTVVDYGASWCDHCKGMLPWFSESSEKVRRERLPHLDDEDKVATDD